MSNTAKNAAVTPADVAALAEEKKLIVPAQNEGLQVVNDEPEITTEDTELPADETPKVSLKERLSALTAKLKDNKKAQITLGVSAVAASAAIVGAVGAYIKYAAKTVAEETLEDEQPADTDTDA